jgi:hypothetical protein
MRDVIDGLRKSYIIISNDNLGKLGPASGPMAIAFGFGIMKGSGFEFHSDAPCNGMAVHGGDVGLSSPVVVKDMLYIGTGGWQKQ